MHTKNTHANVACHLFSTNSTYVYFSPFILPCCVYEYA